MPLEIKVIGRPEQKRVCRLSYKIPGPGDHVKLQAVVPQAVGRTLSNKDY